HHTHNARTAPGMKPEYHGRSSRSQKKTPFHSSPISAKWLTLVDAGSETNLKPWPFDSAVTAVFGVVAVTAIVARLFSTKFPRIWFTASLALSLLDIPLHSISSLSMIPLTRLTGRLMPMMLLGTVKAS